MKVKKMTVVFLLGFFSFGISACSYKSNHIMKMEPRAFVEKQSQLDVLENNIKTMKTLIDINIEQCVLAIKINGYVGNGSECFQAVSEYLNLFEYSKGEHHGHEYRSDEILENDLKRHNEILNIQRIFRYKI